MKLEVKEEAPKPPPKVYVLTLTEDEAKALACLTNMSAKSVEGSDAAKRLGLNTTIAREAIWAVGQAFRFRFGL